MTRGALWAREIRFFTIAALLIAFYMFGWYTPVFHLMYELMPGVKLFRRPADATFVFGALIAIVAGYLVHRWLTDLRRRTGRQRAPSRSPSRSSSSHSRSGFAVTTVGLSPALKPIVDRDRLRRDRDRRAVLRAARSIPARR